MRRLIALTCLLPALIVLAIGCAERRTPTEIEAHPPDWNKVGSADFHGTFVRNEGDRFCVECHALHERGTRELPGCDECHNGPGGHPWGWMSPDSADFHGNAVAASGPTVCQACHGQDYRGGWSGVSCYTCHSDGPSGHPDGWMDPRSSSFHGLAMLLQGVDNCTRCHGHGLGGGTSGVACSECHGVTPPGSQAP